MPLPSLDLSRFNLDGPNGANLGMLPKQFPMVSGTPPEMLPQNEPAPGASLAALVEPQAEQPPAPNLGALTQQPEQPAQPVNPWAKFVENRKKKPEAGRRLEFDRIRPNPEQGGALWYADLDSEGNPVKFTRPFTENDENGKPRIPSQIAQDVEENGKWFTDYGYMDLGPDGKPVFKQLRRTPKDERETKRQSINSLRDDYDRQEAEFRVSYQGAEAINDAAEMSKFSQTGIPSLALVYAFQNMIDPGSVVRGEDVVTIGKQGGLRGQMQQVFDAFWNGKTLDAKTIEDVKSYAQRRHATREKYFRNTHDLFKERADRAGVDKRDVINPFWDNVFLPVPPVNERKPAGGK